MRTEVYLDNSATTRPFDKVIEYISDIDKRYYGNPSSLHRMGVEAEKLIKKSREAIARSLGADTKEIIFTSGGTEANNFAIRGYLEANPRKGKHIITTPIEHSSVLEVFKYLSGMGYQVDYIKVNSQGIIDLDDLKSKISKETALISIILVNNEIGTIAPIDEIVKIKNSINPAAAIHMDAVQAYGKLRVQPKKQGIDMLSISSHKIHGPKGTGAIYADRNIRIKPLMLGGGQEAALRSGTENVTGICGFGLASEIVFDNFDTSLDKVSMLKQLFIDKLKGAVENYKIISPENSLPYILNISFADIRAEVLLHHLAEKNIYISTGAACSSRKNIHSHVLKAAGLPACDIQGAARFSFSAMNSEEDIIAAVEALKEIVPKIQNNRGGKK